VPGLRPFRLHRYLAFAGLIALAGGALGASPAPQPTVGYIVIDRLFLETRMAKAADAAIKAEFAGRSESNQALFRKLRDMTAKYLEDEATLDEPERTRRRRELRDIEQDAERRELAYRDQLLHRNNVERDRIIERARLVIDQVARDDHLEVVLFRGVIWARPGIDITDKIIRQLDK
jgi:outer membrane protein